jgi:hypothetical protein
VEEVYSLDKSGAFTDKSNAQAAQLVRTQLAKAAALLRDLAYTAWIESAKPAAGYGQPNSAANRVSRLNPKYNPEAGSAPPGQPVPAAIQ